MLTKALTIEEMDEAGKGLARLATLSAIDHDGDTYAPGAFAWKDGEQWAQLLTAHDRWAMPFGKARVYEDGDAALAELHLNLETLAGREWHAALKFDIETGKSVQEWSYGYDVLEADFERRGGDQVRVLKKVDVHEVSTVVRGAGSGTRTIAIKSAALKEGRFAELIGELDTMAAAIGEDPSKLSATGRKQLQDIHTALGKSLAIPSDVSDAERGAIEAALAGHMKGLSRRHLGR